MDPVQLQENEEEEAFRSDALAELVEVEPHRREVSRDLEVVDHHVDDEPLSGEHEIAVAGDPLEDHVGKQPVQVKELQQEQQRGDDQRR